MIVARYEVPGVMRKIAPSRPSFGLLAICGLPVTEQNWGGTIERISLRLKAREHEYLAFLKWHELSFDDKYLWH